MRLNLILAAIFLQIISTVCLAGDCLAGESEGARELGNPHLGLGQQLAAPPTPVVADEEEISEPNPTEQLAASPTGEFQLEEPELGRSVFRSHPPQSPEEYSDDSVSSDWNLEFPSEGADVRHQSRMFSGIVLGGQLQLDDEHRATVLGMAGLFRAAGFVFNGDSTYMLNVGLLDNIAVGARQDGAFAVNARIAAVNASAALSFPAGDCFIGPSLSTSMGLGVEHREGEPLRASGEASIAGGGTLICPGRDATIVIRLDVGAGLFAGDGEMVFGQFATMVSVGEDVLLQGRLLQSLSSAQTRWGVDAFIRIHPHVTQQLGIEGRAGDDAFSLPNLTVRMNLLFSPDL